MIREIVEIKEEAQSNGRVIECIHVPSKQIDRFYKNPNVLFKVGESNEESPRSVNIHGIDVYRNEDIDEIKVEYRY